MSTSFHDQAFFTYECKMLAPVVAPRDRILAPTHRTKSSGTPVLAPALLILAATVTVLVSMIRTDIVRIPIEPS